MAWTSPLTAVANVALTAAQWNASVRDNLLMTAPALATTAGSFFAGTGTNTIAERIPNANTVGAAQSTGNTTYTNLATVGPTLARVTGPQALVLWGAEISNGTTGVSSFMSFDVTGATPVSTTDASALKFTAASGYPLQASRALLQSLTPGTNTFTARYRVDGGTGTFSQRSINIIPF